jgi:hypothetical protein
MYNVPIFIAVIPETKYLISHRRHVALQFTKFFLIRNAFLEGVLPTTKFQDSTLSSASVASASQLGEP